MGSVHNGHLGELVLKNDKMIGEAQVYLNEYLDKGKELEGVSVPTSFGVDDVALNSLIRQLVEIQIKKNISIWLLVMFWIIRALDLPYFFPMLFIFRSMRALISHPVV